MWKPQNATTSSKKLSSPKPEQFSMEQQSVSQMDPESWAMSSEAFLQLLGNSMIFLTSFLLHLLAQNTSSLYKFEYSIVIDKKNLIKARNVLDMRFSLFWFRFRESKFKKLCSYDAAAQTEDSRLSYYVFLAVRSFEAMSTFSTEVLETRSLEKIFLKFCCFQEDNSENNLYF